MDDEKNLNNTEEVNEKDNNENSNVETRFSKKTRRVIIVIAILIFGILFGISYRANYIDYLGIGENYVSVFEEKMSNRYLIMGICFVIMYILMYITNKIIFRGLKKFFEDEKKELPRFPNKSISFVISLVGSIIYTNLLADKFAIFKNAAVFGIGDPIFNIDLSYYMFSLPFIQTLLLSMIAFFIVIIIYVALYYVIVLNIHFDGVDVEILKKNTFVKQEIFLVMVVVIILCTYVFINAQNIFTQNMVTISDKDGTELIGAGKTDVTIRVWGYRILSFVIIIAIIRLFRYIRKGNFKQSIVSIAIVPTYLIGLFLVMIVFQSVFVGKNELDNEQQYISHNIENTKNAYGINIEQKTIENYKPISSSDVKENSEVINNIPLVSSNVTLSTISDHQENSVYYTYENTFLTDYKVNGIRRLLYFTPREILTDSSINYNSKTYRYTHGYSLVANSANEFDSNGYIKYILSDFTNEEILGIKEPRIYFGLHTNSTIQINTSFGKEYDYPHTATTYNENVYDGKAGLNLGFIDKVILGIHEGNIRLAFTRGNSNETKTISNRNIIERAKTIFPDVLYDENPYLVITKEGKLVWVLDAYTRSAVYPYSQYSIINIKGYKEKTNYIRNSVKVLIDAFDGTTTFYITDKTDPIIMTYRNMYPDLFIEDEIPDDIKSHLVYPKFLYDIQASVIDMYHDVSEDTLYRADDLWEITRKLPSTSSVSGVKMDSYYTMLKTSDEKNSTLGLLTTYSKIDKQNIISYLIGTVENGNPKLSLYKFTQDSNIVGITQLNSQIEQDETISSELKTINTTGTRLLKDMIIVPINNTLLYVEPVYQLMLNESNVPILKKVIVASGNTVAIGDTLQTALTNLFSDNNSVNLDIIDTDDINEIIDSVIKANHNLNDSLSSNDFEMIGKDITSLQSLIDQLEVKRKKEIEEEDRKEENSKVLDILNSNKENANTVENSLENNSVNMN